MVALQFFLSQVEHASGDFSGARDRNGLAIAHVVETDLVLDVSRLAIFWFDLHFFAFEGVESDREHHVGEVEGSHEGVHVNIRIQIHSYHILNVFYRFLLFFIILSLLFILILFRFLFYMMLLVFLSILFLYFLFTDILFFQFFDLSSVDLYLNIFSQSFDNKIWQVVNLDINDDHTVDFASQLVNIYILNAFQLAKCIGWHVEYIFAYQKFIMQTFFVFFTQKKLVAKALVLLFKFLPFEVCLVTPRISQFLIMGQCDLPLHQDKDCYDN